MPFCSHQHANGPYECISAKQYETAFHKILDFCSSIIAIFRKGNHLLSLYFGYTWYDTCWFHQSNSLNNGYNKAMWNYTFLCICVAVTPLSNAEFYENRNLQFRKLYIYMFCKRRKKIRNPKQKTLVISLQTWTIRIRYFNTLIDLTFWNIYRLKYSLYTQDYFLEIY